MKNEMVIREVIDIGSTVSAFGYQLYIKDKDGNWSPSLEDRNTWYCPTVIVEKHKNPGATLETDLFGNGALQMVKKTKVIAASEFKQYLYQQEGEKFAEARRLTVKFMIFIRSMLESRHKISKEIYENVPKEVYVTVPLIASRRITEEMLKMAAEAGFTKENGYEKVEKMDEARSLTDLVLSNRQSKFRESLQEMAKDPKKHQTVLFVDIGGLTVDINLALVSYDKEQDYIFKQIGIWPQASDRKNVSHLGGGITLDMAIQDYLLKYDFIHPEVTKELIKAHGFIDFREFKEWANDEFWSKGETPDRLNGLGMDPDRELYPKKNYRDEREKMLSAECFIQEVAADYIHTLINGIRKVLQDGAKHTYSKETGIEVQEETLDWIFITGGGSNIFFMKDLLLGNLPECINNLNLQRIKNDPDRIMGLRIQNKTLACVEGGLLYTDKFILSAVSDYSVELNIYPRYLIKNETKPLYTRIIEVMKKGDVLPKEVPFEIIIPFEYKSSLTGFDVHVELRQNDMVDISKKENLGKISSGKNNMAVVKDVGNVAVEAVKAAAPVAAAGIAGAILTGLRIPMGRELMNGAKHAIANNSGNIRGKLDNYYSDLDFARSHPEILRLYGSFVVNENRMLTGSISASAESIKEKEKPLTINLN